MIGRRSHDDAQAFDAALRGAAPRDEHIAELVRFAEDLCEAAALEPTMQFRDSLRTQLMAEAETVLVRTPPGSRVTTTAPVSRRKPVRRRVASLATALVASAGVVGLVASSASALPGEMLYPVKRTVESVELQLHRDDASRGSFQLAQASERLAEARKLNAKGGSERHLADTLDDFASQAESGSTALFSHFTDSGDEASIREVSDFAAEATVDLSSLSGHLPSGTDQSFVTAAEAVTALATQASSLCGSCSTGDLQQLVSAASELTDTSAPKPTPSSDAKPASKPTATTSAPSTPQPTKGTPTSKPVVVVPTTPSTTRAPSLADVTDPLLGALLGNEEQEGLVPGLLNGLLGGGKR